jgi:hypothetical protein
MYSGNRKNREKNEQRDTDSLRIPNKQRKLQQYGHHICGI